MSKTRPHAFLTLDALRGLGAVVVLQVHLARFFGIPGLPHGPMAVDFFSMLSGFVLSFAYQPKLDKGWSLGAFCKTRIIRVYPVYLAGLLAGLSFFLLRSHLGQGDVAPASLPVLLVLGLLVLPATSLALGGPPGLFPFTVPAWSLFAELVVNLVHAISFRRRSWKVLLAVLLLWAVVLQYTLLRYQSLNVGSLRGQLLVGCGRVGFSYLLGMLLFRFWSARPVQSSVSPILPTALLTGLMLLPTSPSIAVHFDLLLIVTVLPAIILLGAASEVPSPVVRIAELLGASSYSVYMLHVPIAEYLEQGWKRVTGHRVEADAPWPGIACVVATFLISFAVDTLYDEPVRAYLRRRFTSSGRTRVPGAVPNGLHAVLTSGETSRLAPSDVSTPASL